MDYHHQTQPMPNPFSRRAHLMPGWWHRGETLGSHVVQLIAPWLLFLPQPIASFAALAIIVTQLALVITGNYAWLNWATILLAFAGISDSFLGWIVGGPWPGRGLSGAWGAASGAEAAAASGATTAVGAPAALPLWWAILIAIFIVWQCVLNVPALRNLFSPSQLMNASFNRWGLGNAYGAFGSMTESRDEIIIEGTLDPDATMTSDDWRPYVFKGKPGDVHRRPPIVAPYHLRLDWLMWFAALGDYRQSWFYALLDRIVAGDAQIRTQLGPDPFGGQAPALIRVRVFTYRYATGEERRLAAAEGQPRPWWVHSEPRTMLEPTNLRDD